MARRQVTSSTTSRFEPLPLVNEDKVQAAVLNLLSLYGAFVWRNNTRVVMMPGRGGRPRPVRFGGLAGSPDVMAILPGNKFLGVETKKQKGPRGGLRGGKQSEEQIEWQRMCEERDGWYVVARSTDDVEAFLKSKGVASPFAR